jgi:hypothetical protein
MHDLFCITSQPFQVFLKFYTEIFTNLNFVIHSFKYIYRRHRKVLINYVHNGNAIIYFIDVHYQRKLLFPRASLKND